MWMQTSYRNEQAKGGKLYLVPTPIGNLQDMTYRAVETLKEADIIAAEDTRHTKKLCHVFSIDTPLVSYHEHNKRERENALVERAKNGEVIALVSDAGMPAISDPGTELVHRFSEEKIPIIALPGANAALTALVTAALPTDEFTFIGFLDRKKKDKESTLERWKGAKSTLIIYESPHRLKETVSTIAHVLGNRRMTISRELTKQYETIVRGTTNEILDHIEAEGVKGEYVIVVSGATDQEATAHTEESWWKGLTVVEHVDSYIRDKGLHSKEAIQLTAKDRGLKKREVYQSYHVE